MLDPKRFRQLTNDAIERGEKARLAAEEERQRRKLLKDRADRNKAELIIASIPDLCEKAAMKKQSTAEIMKIDYDDFERQTKATQFRDLDPKLLTGVPKIVFEYLEESRMKTYLEYWHDGVGINGGYKLMVSW